MRYWVFRTSAVGRACAVALSAVLLVGTTVSVSSAFVTGFVPGSKKCALQHQIATKAGKAIDGVGACYIDAVKALCAGGDPSTLLTDLESCKGGIKSDWIGATDVLKGKHPDAPGCLMNADVGRIFDDLDTVLQRAANLIACEGTAPLLGKLSGHTPSSCDVIGKAELKVLRKVKGLSKKLAFGCLHKLCVKEQAGKPFDLSQCVDAAKNAFLDKAGKVKHLPQCLADNVPDIADALTSILSADADVLFCESGPPLDPSGCSGGCCQGTGTCIAAATSDDCVGSTFVAQGTCDASRAACVPPTCGIGDDLTCNLDGGDTCSSCGIDCCPAPACGDGFCDPGENSTNCPADCNIV